MKLHKIFNEVLNEDFKTQTRKFISQGIEPEIVKSYIDKFKNIRDNKYKEMFDKNLDIPVEPNKRNDIDAYADFHDLEMLVDYVGGKRPVSTSMSKETIEVTGEPIFKDDNFEVYYADSPRACIKYKGKFPYSWCVARADASNMFYTYRFKPYEPAFYFIKDIKSANKEFGIWNMTKNVFKGEFKNPYHFFVIQVPKNLDIDDVKTQQYIVTSANNDGDKQMSWDEIVNLNPNIAPIHEILEPKPFTPEERTKNERFRNGISNKEFSKLSYEDKRSYLDIYPTISRPISTEQLMELPDDLLNLYVSFGIGLNDEQFSFIKPKKDILKRYSQISSRKFDEYMSRTNSWERRQLKMAYTELILLSDENIKKYLDSLSQKDINKFISDYGEDKLELLEKHLPEKFNGDYKVIKNLVIEANNGSEEALAKLYEMVPEDVEISFKYDYIQIDTSGYGSYLEKNMDSDVKSLLDNIGSDFGGNYYYDYFDGNSDGLEKAYDDYIEQIIKNNKNLAYDVKSIGLGWDLETIKDLLESYGKKESIETIIMDEFSTAKSNAEEKVWDEMSSEIRNIIYLDDEVVNVKIGPFIIFLINNAFFTTDRNEFISNVINLADTILEDYDVPNDYNQVWEQVNEAGYNNMIINDDYIIGKIEDAIEEATNMSNAEDDSADDNKIAKLKSQIIKLLNDTLKGMGQDEFSNKIENELVTIDIDRKRFNLEGKVFIKLKDKKTNESHEGYVYIKDLPTYFSNYKLFEKLNRMKSLIRY